MLSLLLLTRAWAVERQLLTGHIPSATARLQPVGRLAGSSRLNLAIGLPLRNQEALTTLLEQLYDTASPQYRHYLSPEQFTEKFGPAKEDYEALIAFATAQGLAVTATHPNHTLLDVSGLVADIERVFHVTMQVYQHPIEARTFHAPDVDPSLDLAARVLHIGGLDNFHQPQPLGHRRQLDPTRSGKPLSGSGPGGGFLAKDLRAAYVPGVALTGAGQSVALVQFDGYYASDITDYERLAGLPNVPLQNVLLDGFDGRPGPSTFEVALDIEMAISMAPGLSNVILYEAPNSSIYANDVLNRIATDNAAKQINASWTIAFDATTEQIAKQFAAQGQSFFMASGDWGPPRGWIADDPYVTIVGGTELSTSGPGGAWVSETVWNLGYLPTSGQDPSISSGGGISPRYSIPSWQRDLSMAANHGSTTRRNSPDVAMVADNILVLAENGNSQAGWGTSASSPLWAGFTALANELAQAHSQPPVGFINPAIYALGKGASYNSVLHDITTGNNTTIASSKNFFVVSGYDLCTGWGTPNGSNLLYALALPQLLQIAPGTEFTASGPAGGPFNAAAQTYSLTNSGAAALNWTLAYDATWLGSDGGNPFAGLVQALDGNFYGATSSGGDSSDGTAFKLTPNGILTTLHVFSGADGADSRGGLVQGSDGELYGTTRSGGGGNLYDGTVFKITTTGMLSTLVAFNATNNLGFKPRAGLIQGKDGNFYGATYHGGTYGRGTVFRMTPAGLLTTLYSFNGPGDGQWPTAALVQGTDGYFYGTTSAGGAYGDGTVFRMGINGALTTLLYFDGFNGANPSAPLVQAADGSFYGTTINGGANGFGTVFRLSVPMPSLSIALAGSNVVLSWPSWASDLHLQRTSDLTTSNWSAVTNLPVVTNLQNQVTLGPSSSDNTFYRLTH